MWKATQQVDADVLEVIAETTELAPKRMRREAGIVARGPEVQVIIVALSKEPGAPAKPQWVSDRQRIAAMINMRRTNFIPYRRTHRQAQGWRAVLEDLRGGNGGVISFQNSARETDFVQGERQQRQHAATGWVLARLVIRDNEEPMQDALTDAWWRASGAA